MSPAEYFKKTQGSTVTPYGRVVPEAAKDVGDDKVRFETEEGYTCEVTARRHGNGYRYSQAERVDVDSDSDADTGLTSNE